jgi:hypothetical protein
MKLFISLLALIVCIQSISAQNVGIGTNLPAANAALDISSSSKGLLIPRMDSVSRKNIPATTGLMVYDTSTKCFWYHDGTRWVNMPPKGNNTGDVLYWNGTAWTVLPAGSSGQYLSLTASGAPAWSTVNTSGGGTSSNISTQNVSNISPATVQSGGFITSDAGAAITARGVVWSTSPNPTVALTTKTLDGTGIGSFVSNPTGLTPATTYYIRAYYTNANGTTYGNQVTFATIANFSIGQTYGGGKIFYVDGTGQHGLIVSNEDLGLNITWSNMSTNLTTNATGLAIGTGSANTNSIITAQGNGSYAASLCKLFYTGGGFTDWYLPSLYELNQVFLQRNAIGFVPGDPFFSLYWTSSEYDENGAWTIDFLQSGPNQGQSYKGNSYIVRAIRRF